MQVVAPLAGAWIEISLISSIKVQESVAPLAGAWIEIYCSVLVLGNVLVAPLAGAWIEIINTPEKRKVDLSRSPRGSVD